MHLRKKIKSTFFVWNFIRNNFLQHYFFHTTKCYKDKCKKQLHLQFVDLLRYRKQTKTKKNIPNENYFHWSIIPCSDSFFNDLFSFLFVLMRKGREKQKFENTYWYVWGAKILNNSSPWVILYKFWTSCIHR